MFRWDGCLFDADGTLVDTMEMIYLGFARTLARWDGRTITPPEVEALVGIPFRTQLEHYLGPLSDVDFSFLAEDFRIHQYQIYQDHLRLCKGVPEALRRLKSEGVKMGIVTSRSLPSLSTFLTHTGIFQYFSEIITPADTLAHKPDGAPAAEAMARLHLKPEQTLMVGDAAVDILCGINAGCETAFVNWSRIPLGEAKPDYYIDTMTDLLQL